jgi:tetraprenyl-beta-curcumene synthase
VQRDAGPRPPATLVALARANARFWPTVAPVLASSLASWRTRAASIDDDALRALALEKLDREGFNAEVAATLATLAPPALRSYTTRAIVSLELLFDYLDGRTEMPLENPLADGERLFAAFIDAVRAPGAADAAPAKPSSPADWRYRRELSECARASLQALPAAHTVRPVALTAAERCAQAQTRLHAIPSIGFEQLERWARERCDASGLSWREYVAGSASSVLSIHALIAAASDAHSSDADAQRLDAAYLTIGAVITLLDSIVDRREDMATGGVSLLSVFPDEAELVSRMRNLTREAIARIAEAPNSAHHRMTLAGIVAYYSTHAGARSAQARPLMRMVRSELSPTVYPTLGVIRAWRAAKSWRGGVRGASALTR